MADFPDYRNFQIDYYFAKYLITPRYLTYIKYILDTETSPPGRIDLRFYANRANYWDFDNLTPQECFAKIQELCNNYEKNLTIELRQDFISDFIIPGISVPLQPAPKPVPKSEPTTPPSEQDFSGNVLIKKKVKKVVSPSQT